MASGIKANAWEKAGVLVAVLAVLGVALFGLVAPRQAYSLGGSAVVFYALAFALGILVLTLGYYFWRRR